MSSKVPLYFETGYDPHGTPFIRLVVWVAFKSRGKYLEAEKIIIDTGAPISLIPFNIWAQCDVTLGNRGVIGSIANRPECDVAVTYGRITFSLMDEDENEIVKDITIHADLSDTSEMPALLGWQDFLAKGTLFTNYASGEAWLEWPDSPI